MNRREFHRALVASLGGTFAYSELLASAHAPPLINNARLMQHLEALAQFGKNPQGGVSRVGYSDADRQGREYVMGLMRSAQLAVTVDVAGNILGRRAGRESLPAIAFGSHIDSVPEGGNYDGTVGSLGAIEVVQTLQENQLVTRHPLLVTIWANEEQGLYGSRAITTGLTATELANPSRAEGRSIREGIRFIGGDPERLDSQRIKKGDVAAYVELHIEQGGILEAETLDIGIVEGIVGIRQWEVTFEGFANHAGTTPMDKRQDALLTAARFVDMVNRVVRAQPGRQVGTVGRIQALPGAPNVIPGKVIASLELRDLDDAKIEQLYTAIGAETTKITDAAGTRASFRPLHENTAAPTDQRVRRVIGESAAQLGFRTKSMPSGAGHDAQAVATVAPIGMIFIPSVGGISHSPREFSHPKDIANGANVLLRTVLALDEASWVKPD